MAKILPYHANIEWTPEVYPAPNYQESAIGTGTSAYVMSGQRWRIEIRVPALLRGDFTSWSAVTRSGEGVIATLPQTRAGIADEGQPRVKGGGQLGSHLNIDGLPDGLTISEGHFISIITGGQRYLYQLSEAALSANGNARLALFPMLRVPPNDNDVIEIKNAKIEGYNSVAQITRSDANARVVPGFSFSVTEAD